MFEAKKSRKSVVDEKVTTMALKGDVYFRKILFYKSSIK